MNRPVAQHRSAGPTLGMRLGLVLAVILGGALAGCAGTPRTSTSQSPAAPAYDAGRYILMPHGDSALRATLKKRLADQGWQFAAYTADMTRGIDDYRAMARRARYRITLQAEEIGRCETGEPSYRYRIALIENASGDAPITQSGADCLNVVDRDFTTALTTHAIRPAAS